jgi:hypothetical protein
MPPRRNELPGNRPYKELPTWSNRLGPNLTDGWEWVHGDDAAKQFGPYRCGEYIPPPVGPGDFLLPFAVYDVIKTIEIRYYFDAGHEAEIQAAEEGAPIYKIFAPEGFVIIPVGAVREWILRLPAGTSVRANIEKWQWDDEMMSRKPKFEMTPERLELGRKLLEETRKRLRKET